MIRLSFSDIQAYALPGQRHHLRRAARDGVPLALEWLPAPPNARRPFYWFIKLDKVNPVYVSVAEAMKERVEQDLGLPLVRIKWFREVTPAQAGLLVKGGKECELTRKRCAVFGYATSRYIALNADVEDHPHIGSRTKCVAYVTAHELRHVWQVKQERPRDTLTQRQAEEDDAIAYGAAATKRYWPEIREEILSHNDTR